MREEKPGYICLNNYYVNLLLKIMMVWVFTIRLLFRGLDEVLFGCLCISHLQSGYPGPVQRFGIAWSPL